MATGLQLFLPDGRLQLDMTRRLAHPLGIANSARENAGSITVPEFLSEEPWYMIVFGTLATTVAIPSIGISKDVLYWKWPSNSVGAPILYGIM